MIHLINPRRGKPQGLPHTPVVEAFCKVLNTVRFSHQPLTQIEIQDATELGKNVIARHLLKAQEFALIQKVQEERGSIPAKYIWIGDKK